MKYFIETYGCQMNVHDSERMAGLLEQSGYDLAESAGPDRDPVSPTSVANRRACPRSRLSSCPMSRVTLAAGRGK